MNNAFVDVKKTLDELIKKAFEGRCNNCGHEFQWGLNQWKRNCPKCNTVLLRTGVIPKKSVNCFKCMDTGIVTYKYQFDGFVYENGAACICEQGKQFQSEHIPIITQSMTAPSLETIEKINRELCKTEDS